MRTAVIVVAACTPLACTDLSGLTSNADASAADASPVDAVAQDAGDAGAATNDGAITPASRWGPWCKSLSPPPVICDDFDSPVALAETFAPFHFGGEGRFAEESVIGAVSSPPRAVRFATDAANAAQAARLELTLTGAPSHVHVHFALTPVTSPAYGKLLVFRLMALGSATVQLQLDQTKLVLESGVDTIQTQATNVGLSNTAPNEIDIDTDYAGRTVHIELGGVPAGDSSLPDTTTVPTGNVFLELGAIVLGSGSTAVDGAAVTLDSIAVYR